MKNKHKSCEVLLVESERVARLEADMEHTQADVSDIKADIRDIKTSSKNVELAVVELAEIARTNQRLYPRLEALEKKVETHAMQIAKWCSGIAVLVFLASFFGSELKTAVIKPSVHPTVQNTLVNRHEAK